MTDAGGTSTLTKIGDVGQVPIYRLRNTEVTDGETMPLDITGSPIAIESQIIIIGALADSAEKQVCGNDLDIEYDETLMHFTIVLSGLSDTQIDIYFMITDNVKIDLD